MCILISGRIYYDMPKRNKSNNEYTTPLYSNAGKTQCVACGRSCVSQFGYFGYHNKQSKELNGMSDDTNRKASARQGAEYVDDTDFGVYSLCPEEMEKLSEKVHKDKT